VGFQSYSPVREIKASHPVGSDEGYCCFLHLSFLALLFFSHGWNCLWVKWGKQFFLLLSNFLLGLIFYSYLTPNKKSYFEPVHDRCSVLPQSPTTEKFEINSLNVDQYFIHILKGTRVSHDKFLELLFFFIIPKLI
jgi:hypothetical protein